MPIIAKAPTKSRNAVITDWYTKVFPKACTYLHKKGADLETSKELFQQAIVIYYEKITSEHFEPRLSDEAYLMGIVKKLWLKYHNNVTQTDALETLEIRDGHPLEPAAHKLMAFLKSSGEKCMQLLQSYYYENLSMKQLGSRFGFRTERSATVQKFKCLEKVRNTVKEKALSYEDFLD